MCLRMRDALVAGSEQGSARRFGSVLASPELTYDGLTERWFRRKLLQAYFRVGSTLREVDLLTG
jgi:hypothetical protein